jgi:methionine-gamma-lyase
MNDDTKSLGFSTKSIHAGIDWKNRHPYPVNAPIYASSTFAFPDQDYGARVFQGEEPEGYTYSRLANPTVIDVEMRLAAIENAEAAALLSSGMAAVATLVHTICKKGDHVIADKTLYGGSHSLFAHKLPETGIDITFVDASNPDNVRNAIRSNTKLIYFETPTNPNLRLIPIKPIVQMAKQYNITTAVDSTFMTPVLMRPLEYGIDIVLHSATKYLNGQSDLIAGVLLGSKEFIEEAKMTIVHYGGILGPFEAYMLGRGLRTLKLRINQHEQNARQVVEYLKSQRLVKKIFWPGLEDHPQHLLAMEQQDGFGSIIGLELSVDLENTKLFANSLQLITRAVSLGGVESLLCHPASTTHAIVEEEARLDAGISDSYIRLSVGIEDAEDIIADLEQAFQTISKYTVTEPLFTETSI